jgi:hypothetical protein
MEYPLHTLDEVLHPSTYRNIMEGFRMTASIKRCRRAFSYRGNWGCPPDLLVSPKIGGYQGVDLFYFLTAVL